MSKKSSFVGPFDKQHHKRAQRQFESEQDELYQIYWSFWKQLSPGKCVLVICRILRPLFNTLTADDKHSLLNRVNLTQPIHIILSQKLKTFFFNIFCIFQIYINSETFWQKKMTVQADVCPKLRTLRNVVRQLSEKCCFRGPFEKQHGKWA